MDDREWDSVTDGRLNLLRHHGEVGGEEEEEALRQQRALIQKATDEAKGYVSQYGEKAQGWLKPFQATGVKANQSLSDILSGKLNVDDMVQSSSLSRPRSGMPEPPVIWRRRGWGKGSSMPLPVG